MNRKLTLKVVLVLVGLLFLALAYPMVLFMRQEPALPMMLSLYVTLGVFLLLAIRNPPAHRSLILFTAWSSFAHAAVMGYQAILGMVGRGELAAWWCWRQSAWPSSFLYRRSKLRSAWPCRQGL